MKGLSLPIFRTRIEGLERKFDLNDFSERKLYFQLKAGKEIEKIRGYLEKNKTFIAYLIGVKNSGKGTYSKLFMEAVGGEYIRHLSIGDLVRDVHRSLENGKEKEIFSFLKENYRGPYSLAELKDLILNRSTTKLIPSELVLNLIKYEISRYPKKTLFIDGFPRAQDQVIYWLFLKELVGYRNDPDFLVFIDVPEKVIDERIKYRVICPLCQTPRNLKLLPTKHIDYDESSKSFYLRCDQPQCQKQRMVQKEGDELGIEPIRDRLETDRQVFQYLYNINGIEKIYLRNTIPVKEAENYIDDYEITPAYSYLLNNDNKIEIIEEPWIVEDDEGTPSYSLLPAAVAVSLFKQLARYLEDYF